MRLFKYICACIHCSCDPYAAKCIQFCLFLHKYSEFLQSWQQSPANVKPHGSEQLLVPLIGFLWSEKMRNQKKEQLLELSSSACSILIKKKNLVFLSGEKLQEILQLSGSTGCLWRSALVLQQWDLARCDKQWELCVHLLSYLITTK